MYRSIEILRSSNGGADNYIGVAEGEDGNGSYIIVPDENAEIQNSYQYKCMVSKVGVADHRVGFNVIGKRETFLV